MPLFHIRGLFLAAGLLFMAGCPDSTKSPYGGTAENTLSYMVSTDQLAARLGLQNTYANRRYVELSNSTNRVLIFTHPGGNVYVNGQTIGLAGATQREDGRIYVSELLVPRIRGYLISQNPQPQPSYNSPYSYGHAGKTVVIDAGHGGSDPGAISYLGYYEKEVNLKVAQKVAWRLKNQGVRVIMTRNDDTYPELNERAEIANRANADLFVSIHHNSNHSRIHRGFTIYIAPDASEASRRAGRMIEKSMANTGLSSNGMRTNDYRVLMRTQGPAVLVECGYLSNPSEAAILYDGDFQNRIANAIVEGILNAF